MLLTGADNIVKVYRLAFVSFFGKDKFFVALLASLQNFDKAPPAISLSPSLSPPFKKTNHRHTCEYQAHPKKHVPR